MPYNSDVDPAQVKQESEGVVLRAGGRVCEWLPVLEPRRPRSLEAVISRALVMNALLNIHFGAPIPVIRDWIETNGVSGHLSNCERVLLSKNNEELTDQEKTDLCWYIEALWALMWAGGLTPDLHFEEPVPDHTASLVPDLQRNEDGSKFSKRMRLRPYHELFRMLDLYYRVHWYARDGQLNRYATGKARLDVVIERRKALEWLMDDSADWDYIDLST